MHSELLSGVDFSPCFNASDVEVMTRGEHGPISTLGKTVLLAAAGAIPHGDAAATV